MKFAFALLSVASASVMDPREFKFMHYIAEHNKEYKTMEDYSFRLANYLMVDEFIEENNHPDSGETHRAGHNKFSDYSRQEYRAMLGMGGPHGMPELKNTRYVPPTQANANPTSMDWRTSGAVTAVKDQGQCGSCWAFSAVESLESSYFLDTNTLYTLSEQQVVDCCGAKYFNFGCNGGMYQRAWNYVAAGNPVEKESAYPYVSGTTMAATPCTYNASLGKVGAATGPTYSDCGTNTAAMTSCMQSKPQSVGIEADTLVFQTYTSGVITSSKCGTTLDHAVQAVGYNSTATEPYWIVRNSWGTSWGMNGYVNIGMSDSPANFGICGINQAMSMPYTSAP